MQGYLGEAKSVVRRLAKDRLFSLIGVLLIALPVSCAGSILGVFRAAFLEPLPYERGGSPAVELLDGDRPLSISPPDFRDLQEESHALASVSIHASQWVDLTGYRPPGRVRAAYVSSTLFEVFRADAVLGRTLTAEDDKPGGPLVAVASERFWERIFKNESLETDSSVSVNGQPCTIVGVLPRFFEYPEKEVDLWIPIARGLPEAYESPRSRVFSVVTRLEKGVSIAQAKVELDAILQRVSRKNPRLPAYPSVDPILLRDRLTAGIHGALTALLLTALFILLAGYSGVVNLILLRSEELRTDMAVRWALGAGPQRHRFRPMVEAVTLTAAGGVVGFWLALGGLRLLKSLGRQEIPRLDEATLDYEFLALALFGCLFAMVLTVLVSGFRGSDSLLVERLKGMRATAGRGQSNLNSILIITEQVVVLILLSLGGSALWSSIGFDPLDFGFANSDILTFQVVLPRSRYPDQPAAARLFTTYQEKLAALPGVVGVGGTTSLPLAGFGRMAKFSSDPASPPEDASLVDRFIVLPGYLETMGIPIVRGAALTGADDSSEPPVVVDEALAAHFWPGLDPIGQKIALAKRGAPHRSIVVGVAKSIRKYPLGSSEGVPERSGQVYQLLSESSDEVSTWDLFFTIRAPNGRLASLPAEARSVLGRLDPELPILNVDTMGDVLSSFLAESRFYSFILTVLATTGLGVGALSVYGVSAYAISQREREFAVRYLVGAKRRDILYIILGSGAEWLALALVAGLLTAQLAGRFLSSLLPLETQPDATNLVISALLFGAVSLISFCVPALVLAGRAAEEWTRALQ